MTMAVCLIINPTILIRGVPAKEIRKRFAPEVIERLRESQWWNWPVEKIKDSIQDIQSGNIEALSINKALTD